MNEAIYADFIIAAGDFNRTNIIPPARGAVWCTNSRTPDRPLQSDFIIVNAKGAVELDSAPACSEIVNANHNVYNQYELRKEFTRLVTEGPLSIDSSILHNPSDHVPLRMDISLASTGVYSSPGKSTAKSPPINSKATVGIVTWNVLTQGISNKKKKKLMWGDTSELNKQMLTVVECFNRILNLDVQVVCLQEFGGALGWANYFNYKSLREHMAGMPGSVRVYKGEDILPGGGRTKPDGSIPPSLAQVQSESNSWLFFRPEKGRATLIKAAVVDSSRIMTSNEFTALSALLEVSRIGQSSTVVQLPLIVNGIRFVTRVINVHDNYARKKEASERHLGMTNSNLRLSFMRDPTVGDGVRRTKRVKRRQRRTKTLRGRKRRTKRK